MSLRDGTQRALMGTAREAVGAPDLIEHVIGFRAWRLAGGALAPIGLGVDTWDGGSEVRATCSVAARFRSRGGAVGYVPVGRHRGPRLGWHEAPDPACECGLYAWHMARGIAPNAQVPGMVLGAIAARGLVEVHRRGFRAQFAQPVLFAYQDDDRTAIAALGRLHGVEVCAYEELGDRALEFGQPVPAALRP